MEPTSVKPRFLRFGLGRVLVLFVVLAVLGAIAGPKIRNAQRSWQAEWQMDRQAAVDTALAMAIRENSLERARVALEGGANPDHFFETHQADGGMTLERCIENGQIKMMEVLLENGADANLHKHNGEPPLFLAIRSGHPRIVSLPGNPVKVRLEMIRLLIRYGADPKISVNDMNAMGVAVLYQETEDAEVAELLREHGLAYGPFEMAAFNRLDELRTIVEQNPDVLRERFKTIYGAAPGQDPTLLGTALSRGHREMAVFLIEQGAPLDRMEFGTTLLHLAVRGGDVELIRLLLARGVDIDAGDEESNSSALTAGVWAAAPKVVAALIEAGANVNRQRSGGRTALHTAAFRDRAEIVRLLLDAGADPLITDDHGKTAADLAGPTTSVLLSKPK